MKKLFLNLVCLLSCGLFCSCKNHGTVCFTFDDFGGDNWLKADEIFKKYDAHATFLICGELTEKHIEVMKKLKKMGHTVGLHTVGHANAVPDYEPQKYFDEQIKPQLDICRQNGIEIKTFAYPNNRHNDEFDKFMFQYFDYLRAGNGPERKPVFIKRKDIHKKMVLPGTGIGKYYKSDLNELKKLLDKAAEEDSLIVFFSHDIYPDAPGVAMPTEYLIELLEHAHKLKMRIAGAEEL